MPFPTNIIPVNPDKILVIDEMPIVSLALQEIFRTVNTAAVVGYTDNIYRALSSKNYEAAGFDLIIVGSQQDVFPENLFELIQELKERFPKARTMLFAATYDPSVIEKMGAAGIDAYVHKFEPLEEIRKTYTRLSAGEPYISEIFRTLYSDYKLKRK
jgi:DNA-binding NarL/FixJ family response regulator